MMRDLVVPAADIVTPNQFELEFLTETSVTTLDEVLAGRQRAPGARTAYGPGHQRRARRRPGPRVDDRGRRGGSLVGHHPGYCRRRSPAPATSRPRRSWRNCSAAPTSPQALGETAAVMYGLLSVTHASGRSELALVEAQDELVAPSRLPRRPTRLLRSALDHSAALARVPLTRAEPSTRATRSRRATKHSARRGGCRATQSAQSRKTSMLAPRALSRLARSS